MRNILSATDTLMKLCGKQSIRSDTRYRLTRHSLAIPCDDGTLLYHTMTGSLYRLTDDEYSALQKLPDALTLEHKMWTELAENWYLLPESFDECEHVRQLRRLLRLLKPPKPFKDNFTIFTTTDCNARCFYCYERGIERVSMTEQTARDAAQYIIRSCVGNPVKLHWFGGEPLCNIPAIDVIAGELTENGVAFESSMTSNAYFLDRQTAERAKQLWKVRQIQITLDGTRDVYNRTKAYIQHDGDPYSRVLDNIGYALDAGIRVIVRLNMDRVNADDLMTLCDEVYRRFGARDDLECIVQILQEWAGKVHRFASDEELLENLYRIIGRLKELGLAHGSPLFREQVTNHCIADNDACETIMPDGRIGKCDQYQGKDLVGSIYSDERDTVMLNAWKERVEFPECGECPLFPRCFHLKKCNYVMNGCTELDRTIHRNRMVRQVKDAYRNAAAAD